MTETIAIGERSGVLPVITHMKVQGHEQGRADEILKRMRDADRDRNAYVAADVYPYLAGQTGLVALIIPGWAQDGGRDAMLQRFKNPELRARIVQEAEDAMNARFGGAAGVYLPATKQELTTIMRELNVRAGEAVVRTLEQGSPGIIARFGIEADLVKILQYEGSSIACDCGSVARDASHPRYYGTFPRVLGRYVREQKALTWEDAVRKMSGLPAATVGFVDRGLVAAGMHADVTVFDPATVIDHATFEEPMLPSDGIRHVLVNGQFALRDGRPTGAHAGQALRRTSHMPSRRQITTGNRSWSTMPGDYGSAHIEANMTQRPGARAASGTFKLGDAAAGVSIDVKTFGVLQGIQRGWFGFTARASVRPGEPERSIVVTTDIDPIADDPQTHIVVDAGDYHLDARRR
jgi:hypothetical protein